MPMTRSRSWFSNSEAVYVSQGIGVVVRRLNEMSDGLREERAGAARRIKYALIQRVGHDLPHHRPRQPVRSVVLAQLAAPQPAGITVS